ISKSTTALLGRRQSIRPSPTACASQDATSSDGPPGKTSPALAAAASDSRNFRCQAEPMPLCLARANSPSPSRLRTVRMSMAFFSFVSSKTILLTMKWVRRISVEEDDSKARICLYSSALLLEMQERHIAAYKDSLLGKCR